MYAAGVSDVTWALEKLVTADLVRQPQEYTEGLGGGPRRVKGEGIHVYIYIHTYTHAYIRICIYTHTHTHTYMDTVA